MLHVVKAILIKSLYLHIIGPFTKGRNALHKIILKL